MSITIIIQAVDMNNPIKVQVNQTDYIKDAKRKFVDNGGKSQYNQWIYDAEILDDNKKIKDFNIEDKDEITANESWRGGLNQLKS